MLRGFDGVGEVDVHFGLSPAREKWRTQSCGTEGARCIPAPQINSVAAEFGKDERNLNIGCCSVKVEEFEQMEDLRILTQSREKTV